MAKAKTARVELAEPELVVTRTVRIGKLSFESYWSEDYQMTMVEVRDSSGTTLELYSVGTFREILDNLDP